MYVHMLLGCTLRGNAYGVVFCLSIVPGGKRQQQDNRFLLLLEVSLYVGPANGQCGTTGERRVADACMTLPKGDRWNHLVYTEVQFCTSSID